MSYSARHLNPSEAAKRLGVSTKALRLYEQRGLLAPVRTAAGWRAYGPTEMARAAEIVALRDLGLSLAQIARVLKGSPDGLEPALAAQQAILERQVRQINGTVEKVRAIRENMAAGRAPSIAELARLMRPAAELSIAFNLPWPWGRERFELFDVRSLNYIVGPLGSGKTRLARTIAEALPGAAFIDLERLADNGARAQARIEADPSLKGRVDRALAWLVEDGAEASGALIALLAASESEEAAILVIDMVEQGLNESSQVAVSNYLRRRGAHSRPVFLLTRSSSILDLDAVTAHEAIILCPANHSPPRRIEPCPGAPGYEAVATCLASPAVRARTEGIIAWRPQVA